MAPWTRRAAAMVPKVAPALEQAMLALDESREMMHLQENGTSVECEGLPEVPERTIVVSFEAGPKNVYWIIIYMVSIWFQYGLPFMKLESRLWQTMTPLWFHYDVYYDFTVALLIPNLVILEFVNKI